MVNEILVKVDKLKIENGDTLIVKSNGITMEQLGNLHKRLKSQGIEVNIIKLNLEDSIEKLDDHYKKQLIIKWQEELK